MAQTSGTGSSGVKSEKQSSAWTLNFPLGFHVPSTIDTLTYNYQRQAVPSLVSDATALTGNLGAESQTQIYFDRQAPRTFFFENAMLPYMVTAPEQRFYNVYRPMTLLSYNLGGDHNTKQDRLRATFAGNVNRRIGIGAWVDYLVSMGSYEYQAAQNVSFGISGYYKGDRYEAQAFYNHWDLLNKENGGITDDLYITDPAQLQGGVSTIQPKSIPTRLTTAHSRLFGNKFYMSHAYNVGYWKEVQVNDTLARRDYVPVLKFIYSMDVSSGRHLFINKSAEQDFWENHYFDPTNTFDVTEYWGMANTFGINMIEGFRKWVKFGLSAYITYDLRRFSLMDHEKLRPADLAETSLTPLPEGFVCRPDYMQHHVWVGGRLDKTMGTLLTYDINARFGLIGDIAGDIDVSGIVGTKFRLFGDTVSIKAKGFFRNTEAPLLLKHYVSNNFAWNNDFGKTRTLRIGGELTIPWTKTRLSAGFENVQNMLYFNTSGMPCQEGGSIQVVCATLDQKLRFGIWNWNNTVTFQTTSNDRVLPLPMLTVYSNMFLNFKAFRVLEMQIGVDCDYYTLYRGVNYQPATMSFTVGDDWQIGNYPFCNAYVTAKLYKVRFYLMFSNVAQGLFGNNYFSMPHYPLNPRRFQLGLSVDFAN